MAALVFILPTAGARTYRGKYPSRARSLSSGATGYHIELNDGTRLWSMSPIADDEGRTGSGLKALYAFAQMNARAMSQDEYAELTRAAEKLRGMIGIAGHGRRERLARDVRAMCLAIVTPYAEIVSPDVDPIREKVSPDACNACGGHDADCRPGYCPVAESYTDRHADAMRQIGARCRALGLPVGEIAPFADSYVERERQRLARPKAAPVDPAPVDPAPVDPAPVRLRQLRGPDGQSVLVASPACPPLAVMVANTTRACYWRTETGFYIATGPNCRAPVDTGAGYARLDSLMRLKGESEGTINAAIDAMGAPPVDPAPALALVTGRSIDGMEYLTAHGFCNDAHAALVMPMADALEIAAREETKAAATRSPDDGVYRIKAVPYRGPVLYTLADYDADGKEAAALDALYGDCAPVDPMPLVRRALTLAHGALSPANNSEERAAIAAIDVALASIQN